MIDKQVFNHAQIIDREPDLLGQFARIIAPAVRDGDQHRTARNAPRLHERLGWVFDIYRAGLAGNRRVKLRQSGLSANAVATLLIYSGIAATRAKVAVLWERVSGNAKNTPRRSDEHTSELQSLMRIAYA